MSDKRSRSGLFSRLAAPLTDAARRLSRRAVVDELTPEAAEREKKSARQAAQESNSGQLTDDDFRLGLDQLLREDQGRFGIKLHVVSLVEFREAVGERWSKVSDKVMMIAEGVVAKHLGAGNLASRQGSDFFTLLFRTCDNAEAGRRAHAIAQELGVRLVGDQFQGSELPLALSAELDLNDALNPDGSLNFPAIHRAVGEKRSLLAAAAGETVAPPAWSPALSKPAAAKAPQDLPTAATSERKPKELQDPGWVAMNAPKRIRDDDTAWIMLEAAHPPPPAPGGAEKTAASRTIPGPPPLNDTSRLSLLWRPTWEARSETIGVYAARLQRLDGPNAQPMEGCLAYPLTHGESVLTLDRFGIAGALRDFRACENAGLGSSVVIPIHWRTLTADNRMELLAPFADLTEQARQTRVMVDVFGIPADAHPRAMTEVVEFTKKLCREVALRTSLRRADPAKAADCGAAMIGLDLSQLDEADRTGDDALLHKARTFLDAAQKSGLAAYMWGARRRALVVGAVHSGFTMVNGPALMKDLPKPAKSLPAPKARFTLAGR